MANKIEASVVLARCNKTKSLFGIRIQKMYSDWHMTWAFEVNEKTSKKEKFDKNRIAGNVILDEEYPGCPRCNGKSFVQCGSCKKLSCYDGTFSDFTCPWCGSSGTIESADYFELKGGGY